MTPADGAIRLLAGSRARARIEREGLRPRDIVGVAAAAGGPKGLALLPLDRWVFGDWLPRDPASATRRVLAGASIGAWRMAACAQREPLAALDRLEQAYLERQRYPLRPSPRHVSQVCREILQALIGGDARDFLQGMHPRATLAVVTARSAARRDGPLALRSGFARAALSNAVSRERLAAHLSRLAFVAGDDTALLPALPPDRFGAHTAALSAEALEDALLASGSIPLVADPVRNIAGAPGGDYWDGGLIDYHLYWRWSALDGVVLYPHFAPRVTAGWLDKLLPWRSHGVGAAGRDWLDNVLLVVPSDTMLARLPGGRLPDRKDFHRYGLRHDARLSHWRSAIGECARMAEALARFVERPDPTRLEPLRP